MQNLWTMRCVMQDPELAVEDNAKALILYVRDHLTRHSSGSTRPGVRTVFPSKVLAQSGTGGTGLGLSIARNIAQSGGRDQFAQSAEDGGSRRHYAAARPGELAPTSLVFYFQTVHCVFSYRLCATRAFSRLNKSLRCCLTVPKLPRAPRRYVCSACPPKQRQICN